MLRLLCTKPVKHLHAQMRNWRYNNNNNNNNINDTKLFLHFGYFILCTIHAHGGTYFLAMVTSEHSFHHPESDKWLHTLHKN